MSLGKLSARGPLARTVTIAAVAGLCAVGLVQYLTHTLEKRPRFAGTIAEPEVTGSIAPARPLPVPAGVRSIPLGPGTGKAWLLVRGP